MKKTKDNISNIDNVKILNYVAGDMGDFIGALCIQSYKSYFNGGLYSPIVFYYDSEWPWRSYISETKRWDVMDYITNVLHADPRTSNNTYFKEYPEVRNSLYRKIILPYGEAGNSYMEKRTIFTNHFVKGINSFISRQEKHNLHNKFYKSSLDNISYKLIKCHEWIDIELLNPLHLKNIDVYFVGFEKYKILNVILRDYKVRLFKKETNRQADSRFFSRQYMDDCYSFRLNKIDYAKRNLNFIDVGDIMFNNNISRLQELKLFNNHNEETKKMFDIAKNDIFEILDYFDIQLEDTKNLNYFNTKTKITNYINKLNKLTENRYGPSSNNEKV